MFIVVPPSSFAQSRLLSVCLQPYEASKASPALIIFGDVACDQDGKEEAQTRIEVLEKDKKKLERKLAALTAKSSALKEANESQAVTLDGLQVLP